jgi:2-polyprenyl-3-methyl-5-hydroxy-6-metoxy-1,4-benzoquinol methylase
VTRFDLALFLALNEEYRDKPIVARPRSRELDALAKAARFRIQGVVDAGVDVRGKRVLEVGCGYGALTRVLVEEYDCEVVGLDIREYPQWKEICASGIDLRVLDISTEDSSALGQFDVILSFTVLEHVLHPFGFLSAVERLLRPGGKAHLTANLYRGPKASHRYREVFFPWPHLLFTDEVFREFYAKAHRKPKWTAAWVNKLTHAHYETYLREIGFARHTTTLSQVNFDEAFYARFHDLLGRYPRYDLSHDFIYLTVGPRSDAGVVPIDERTREAIASDDAAVRAAALEERNRVLERELTAAKGAMRQLRAMEASTSWRVTAPLRMAGQAARSARRIRL